MPWEVAAASRGRGRTPIGGGAARNLLTSWRLGKAVFASPCAAAMRACHAAPGTWARLGNGGHFGFAPAGSKTTRRPVEKQETPVPDDLAEVRYQVALANRMLANEGVLDAFGHVSVRHPTDPGRYPGVHARFRAGRAADGAVLRRAGDPRLHLSGAAGRDGGLPPSRPRGDAVLYRRCSHRSGLSLGRGGGGNAAVLESARRVRRYQSAGGQAGGGPLARSRARLARRGAHE